MAVLAPAGGITQTAVKGMPQLSVISSIVSFLRGLLGFGGLNGNTPPSQAGGQNPNDCYTNNLPAGLYYCTPGSLNPTSSVSTTTSSTTTSTTTIEQCDLSSPIVYNYQLIQCPSPDMISQLIDNIGNVAAHGCRVGSASVGMRVSGTQCLVTVSVPLH
ncbi:MAG: hypothetical protein KGH94_04080 [Candidatus Micrarchaeota archaeon]|nr:hypothetical protein [Candidatus Micrarchaeota archaeon]